MKSLIFFRFHFPLGNPALSSISLTAPGAVGFKQVADEFRSFKSKSLSKAPGVTLEEFGQILKVRPSLIGIGGVEISSGGWE